MKRLNIEIAVKGRHDYTSGIVHLQSNGVPILVSGESIRKADKFTFTEALKLLQEYFSALESNPNVEWIDVRLIPAK